MVYQALLVESRYGSKTTHPHCEERHRLPIRPDNLPCGEKTSGLTLEKDPEAIRPWLLRSTERCPYCCRSIFPEKFDDTT
jgi:hypothetical protein